MRVRDLIEKLRQVDPDKFITPLANSCSGEDEDFDLYLNNIEVWNDGDESITLFMSNITELDTDFEPIERVPKRKLNSK
tara:strand:+ start:248 stop:484 length:237 start_codon:yes stop_codon:yes gene_type:complete